MTDLKIVTIGPETTAALGLVPLFNGRDWSPALQINHAEVALTYPAGDIVAVDVFDRHDTLIIGDGDDVITGSTADAITSRFALVARLVIGSAAAINKTAPGTIRVGDYELP